MIDIKVLAVVDREKGYCGKNIIFKTIKKTNNNTKIAIVGIEEQEKRQAYCASLYILLPFADYLSDACKCFIDDNTGIIHNNKRLEKCIKNFGYTKNDRFDTDYDLCDFVNIEDKVYLCFHLYLGDKKEQRLTFEEYFNMIANTYNDVVSVIFDVFHIYCLEQLDKKKIECFDKILQEKPAGFFLGYSAVQEYTDYNIKLNTIYKHLADTYNVKIKKLQSQRILYDRKKYNVNGSFN